MVVGLGMAGEYSASATYIIESRPQRMRNTASGMLLSGYPLGGVPAAKTYAWVVPHTSWQVLWIGILPVIFAVHLRRRLPAATEWQQSKDAGERPAGATALLFTGHARAWTIPVCPVAGLALLQAPVVAARRAGAGQGDRRGQGLLGRPGGLPAGAGRHGGQRGRLPHRFRDTGGPGDGARRGRHRAGPWATSTRTDTCASTRPPGPGTPRPPWPNSGG
ncbi:hypothetical protein [Streptomyces sp. NBC_01198]|uniref:hypothetical protein n=1 Tax=Streptomyces sp. NBC_01198 TaxID=2903769 RepID=UPI003FA36D12